jgi:hypothetical protein
VPRGPGQTPDERRAAIDKRLDDSLGSFDASLRKEQQTVAQERDAHQAGATTTTEAQTTDKSGAADASGSTSTERSRSDGDASTTGGKRGNSDSKSSRPGDLKSDKASNKADDNAGNGATAREIPDGSDDDVVARRLRKAAEQETDPELKEKLWKEYADYKKNAQGK